jgi:hypothetical protein
MYFQLKRFDPIKFELNVGEAMFFAEEYSE